MLVLVQQLVLVLELQMRCRSRRMHSRLSMQELVLSSCRRLVQHKLLHILELRSISELHST